MTGFWLGRVRMQMNRWKYRRGLEWLAGWRARHSSAAPRRKPCAADSSYQGTGTPKAASRSSGAAFMKVEVWRQAPGEAANGSGAWTRPPDDATGTWRSWCPLPGWGDLRVKLLAENYAGAVEPLNAPNAGFRRAVGEDNGAIVLQTVHPCRPGARLLLHFPTGIGAALQPGGGRAARLRVRASAA